MENDNNITIEGSTATWIMPRLEGDNGGSYVGTFVFNCYLRPMDQLKAGRDFRELLGNFANQATETEIKLALALSQLKYKIIKAPVFWNATLEESGIAGNIGDLNVIAAVSNASILAEEMYIDKIEKERNDLLDKSIKLAEAKLQKRAEDEK
jgi:hypothetical protein